LLTAFQSGQQRLLAPDFINIEFSNIVWKKQVRQGLSAEDAEVILNDFPLIGLALTSSGDLLRDAYNLAVTYERTIYDSLYLALSLREQCQMVTADERLFNSVGTALPNVVLLANWS
jgi:predicted nucleic acid-binding protein